MNLYGGKPTLAGISQAAGALLFAFGFVHIAYSGEWVGFLLGGLAGMAITLGAMLEEMHR